ncbi:MULTISPECIES: AbrB/MazE/SpoVT family DNA-binding domain-containing protein [Methylobacterium]|jgi:antitoxin VapB|uniref:Virulence-associated protein n=1 Tax=Methylobacterium oryzae CBMB20 TaxID=693986 RepID=A0A089Q1R6_9HYPH|nr:MULTISPECIES: AbrB/MazE/SpoVT family DNA-binding domain-containing protein [Methylobacterium]AIQ88529.1 Virulence-associated protein [Methylobacterium oryzae CBMB20]WFS08558.1 antitoxin [Methylobacterium sp. 391_Methyba4]
MIRSPVLTSDRSHAVRLVKAGTVPADVHPADIVEIGRSRAIVPEGHQWKDLFRNEPRAGDESITEPDKLPTNWRKIF